MPAVNELINVYRFSTGRRAFAVGQVREVAVDLGDELIARRAEELLEHDRGTLEKERLWKTAKKQKSSGRGRAVELDNRLDRNLSGMFTSVRALRDTLDRESELAKRCDEFLTTTFPQGPGAITNLEFEDQLGAMEDIVRHLATISDAQAKEMHISPFNEQLAVLVPLFASELDQPGEKFSFKVLRAARTLGHEMLCELIATIVANHAGRAPENVEKRRRLYAPIAEQNERVRVRLARRPAPDVEVDPVTGEELDTEDDDADDPAGPRS